MTQRRRPPTAPTEALLPTSFELGVFRPHKWGAPDNEEPSRDWKAAHRAASAGWEDARQDWYRRYGHLPAGEAPPDEPFDGSDL